MSLIIGTAGHVDHGKSTLIKALTGIDPDRWEEEKRREMTIDLGFAWLTLEDGREIGFIDVPGHRDFIENMLAGIDGIDGALIVIDAEEGIMPQTREHVAIITLLGITEAIVALTKIDRIHDPDWLALVTLEIETFLSSTPLGNTPIIPVSAYTGEGLTELLASLGALKNDSRQSSESLTPWLPIDRVFTKEGFGTVVTGTLVHGQLSTGDTVRLLPSDKMARIRGIQNYQTPQRTAVSGKRTAINLTGISADEIKRGDVLTIDGAGKSTDLVDARLSLLASASRELTQNDQVKFFCGSAEVMAEIRVIGKESISPGSSDFCQLVLENKLAIQKKDRFIIRWPSPSETIGGGTILDPHPQHKYRRYKDETLAHFTGLNEANPGSFLLSRLHMLPFFTDEEGLAASDLESSTYQALLERMIIEKKIVTIDSFYISAKRLEALALQAAAEVKSFHEKTPLLPSMPLEVLRKRLDIPLKPYKSFLNFLGQKDALEIIGDEIRLSGYQICYTKEQARLIATLQQQIATNPSNPPSVQEAVALLGKEVFTSLVHSGQLIRLNDQVFFTVEDYQRFRTMILTKLQKELTLSIAKVRDALGSSRKYALALLEALDKEGVTRREGDYRLLSDGVNLDDLLDEDEG